MARHRRRRPSAACLYRHHLGGWAIHTKVNSFGVELLLLEYPDGERRVVGERAGWAPGLPSFDALIKWSEEMIHRRNTAKPTSGATLSAGECELSTLYPAVKSWLTDVTYADGSPRTSGSVTLFRSDDGSLRMCITDKDSDEVGFITGSSLSDLLDKANRGISEGTIDFRTGRKPGAKRK